jgi:hypothetical protein
MRTAFDLRYACWIFLCAAVPLVARGAEDRASTGLCVTRVNHEVIRRSDAARVILKLEISNAHAVDGEARLDVTFPEGAVVDRLGLWVRGRYMEGELAPRGQAEQAYEEYAHERRVDPALLVWTGERTAQLSVFPVPAESSSLVQIAYVVPLAPGAVIRVPLPLEQQDAASAKLEGEWPIDLKGSGKVKPGKPSVAVFAEKPGADAAGFFSADIVLSPEPAETPLPDVVLVLVDTSFSMRRFDWAAALDEMAALRATKGIWWMPFDLIPGEAKPLQSDADRALLKQRIADRDAMDGASDLSAALRAAVAFLKAQSVEHGLIYWVTDGDDTWGAPDVASWTAALDELGSGRVAVELARPDARTARALGGYHRKADRFCNVTLEPMAGVQELGNSFHPVVRQGGTVRIVGRCTDLQGTVLMTRTLVDGHRVGSCIELKFTVKEGNEHLPRLWAAGRIADFDLAYRLEASPERRRESLTAARDVALKYQILSRFTSFIVLERERDFRRSGIDRSERSTAWAEPAVGQLRLGAEAGDGWQSQSFGGSGAAFSQDVAPMAPGLLSLESVYERLSRTCDTYDPGLLRWLSGKNTRDADRGERCYGLPTPADLEGALRWGCGLPGRAPGEGERLIDVTPPCVGPKDGASEVPLPEAFRRLWDRDFGARVCFDAQSPECTRWIVERKGDAALLIRLPEKSAPVGMNFPDRFALTPDGLLIDLPLWGLRFRYCGSQADPVPEEILDEFPFPTLIPLEALLRGFIDVQVSEQPDAWVLWLESGYRQFQYRLDKTTGLPLSMRSNSSYGEEPFDITTSVYRHTDGRIVWSRGESVQRWTCSPWNEPMPARLLPEDAPIIGEVDRGALWSRVRVGAGWAEDFLNWALSEDNDADRAPILELALKKKPRGAVECAVRAVYAEALFRTGRRADAAEQMKKVRKWLQEDARRAADSPMERSLRNARSAHYEVAFAHLEANSSPDPKAVWLALSKKTGLPDRAAQTVQAMVKRIEAEGVGYMAYASGDYWWGTVESVTKDPAPSKVTEKLPDPGEMLRTQDVAGMADYLVNGPDKDVNDLMPVFTDSVYSKKPFWPREKLQELVLRLVDRKDGTREPDSLLTRNSGNNDFVQDLNEWLVERRPNSLPTAGAYLRLQYRSDAHIEEYLRVQRARRLLQPPFSPAVQFMAAGILLKECCGAVDDRPALIRQVAANMRACADEKLRKEGITHFLAGTVRDVGVVWSQCLYKKAMDEGDWAFAKAILEAWESLAPPEDLALQTSYRAACRHYVLALEEAGRPEEARVAGGRFFAVRPMGSMRSNVARDMRWNVGRDFSKLSADDLVSEIIFAGKATDDVREEIARRHIGDEITRICLRRYMEAPWVFRTDLVRAVKGEQGVREMLATLAEIRRVSGLKGIYRTDVLRLAFKRGMLREAVAEADALLREAPAVQTPAIFCAAALSLLGDGQEDLRAWHLIRRQLSAAIGAGRAYLFVQDCLVAASMEKAAFEIRQEALAECRRLRDSGAFGRGPVPAEWQWLETYDQELLDNVALAKGGDAVSGAGVLRPVGTDFRADLEAAFRTDRWDDLDRLITTHFGSVNDETRFKWYEEWYWSRRREPCPVLSKWFDEVLEKGAAVPEELTGAIGSRLQRRSDGVAILLKYAEQRWAAGAFGLADWLVDDACDMIGSYGRPSNEKEKRALFDAAVNRFGWYPDVVANALWRDAVPQDLVPQLVEVELDQCRRQLQTGFRRPSIKAMASAASVAQRKAKIDAMADEVLKQRPVPPLAAAFCAAHGWGSRPAGELWEIAAADRACILLDFTPAYLDYLRLAKDERKAIEFIRWASRVRPDPKWADALVEWGDHDGATKYAVEWGYGFWLATHGHFDALALMLSDTADEWEACVCKMILAAQRKDVDEWLTSFLGYVNRPGNDFGPVNPDSATRAVSDALNAMQNASVLCVGEEKQMREFERRLATALLNHQDVRANAALSSMAARLAVPSVSGKCSKEERREGWRLLSRSFAVIGGFGSARFSNNSAEDIGRFAEVEEGGREDVDSMDDRVAFAVVLGDALREQYFRAMCAFPSALREEQWLAYPKERRASWLRHISRLMEEYPSRGRRPESAGSEKTDAQGVSAEQLRDGTIMPDPMMREAYRQGLFDVE